MARFPQEQIEQLKNEVSVEHLVASAGIALRQSGKDRLGLCPFHADGEPSLVVTPGKNLWHCFGCQIGGGPIDWVMKWHKVPFRDAVALLRDGSSLAAGGEGPPLKRAGARGLPPPVAFDADDQALLNQTVAYYHETLLASPEALAYLAARGLDHPELATRFQLGYANRTLGLRLPEKNRLAGADIRSRLQKVGVLRASGHEHFNGSLVVPVFDGAGHVTEIYGRKVRDDLRKGTPAHLYLPGPHRGVWNEAGLAGAGAGQAILCEALIDAMTFWCAGFTHVTAAYGVEGFTDEHLAAFKRYGVTRVLIAYDADEAGDRAAARLAELLLAEGIECLRVRFPQGLDANAYALRRAPARQSLGLALRQAEWIGRPAEAGPVQALAEAPAPAAEAEAVEPAGDELALAYGERHWRIRGWRKNLSPEQMRVNLMVRRALPSGDGGYHVDTLDLYAARARAAYLKQASIELALPEETIKRDLGHVLLRLETLQDEAIRAGAQPKSKAPVLSLEDEQAAMALLRAPDLVARIVADMERCGVVGEANNLLAGYLAAVSRKLDAPLAILIQSSSAAGKSSLMDAVLAMVPAEERVQYSAMTGQSLFYLGETDMQHKILAIAGEEHESRGSGRVSSYGT